MAIKVKPIDIEKMRVKVWINQRGEQETFPTVTSLSSDEIFFDRELENTSGIDSITIYLMGVKREWREYHVSDFSHSSCNDRGLSYTINKKSEAKFKQDFLFARCK